MSRKRSVGRTQTRLLDYIDNLGWNCQGLRPNEMLSALVEQEWGGLNWSCCPCNPQEKAGEE